jgi:hypothetical protein
VSTIPSALAWGKRIGLGHVSTVLRYLAQAYGEDHIALPWLQRAVHATHALGAHHG